VRRVEIDLASSSCRIDFRPGPAMSHAMAHAFADSIREAASASPRAGRVGWWRRSSSWSRLTAYATAGDVSVWETLRVEPGRVRLRHRWLAGDPAPLDRVADAMAGVEDIRACRVALWSRTIV